MLRPSIAAAMLLATALPAFADAVTYTGTIGNIPVVMELSHPIEEQGEALYGRYFYPKKGVDIPLSQVAAEPGSATLVEEKPCTEETCPADDDGNVIAPILGAKWTLATADSGETITGTWAEHGQSLEVALTRAGERPVDDWVEQKPANLTEYAVSLLWSPDRQLTMETSPYDLLKMKAVPYEESAVTDWNGSSFRYVTDPRTKFAYPRVVELAGGADAAAANAYLEARHYGMNADALNCSAMQYPGMGWNKWIAWAAGGLGDWDSETVTVRYLSPTVMSWTESGSLFCGGAHPYNHYDFYNLDVRTGQLLDLSNVFAVWGAKTFDGVPVELAEARKSRDDYQWGALDPLIDYVLANRTPGDPDFEAECMTEDLIRSNLTISFKEGDRVLFGLGGLPHAIQACGDDVMEMPLADLPKEFFTAEAAEYFPVLKD